MTILLGSNSLILVQETAGAGGHRHTRHMFNAGTRIVGGANPRKVGTTLAFEVEGYGPAAQHVRNGDVEAPIFSTVAEGMAATGANTTVVFVPPALAKDATLKMIDTGIQTIVVITEGIPIADATALVNRTLEADVHLIGPNCPGIISPGQSNVSITPADITGPGRTDLVLKSGTLTYQLAHELCDIGFTTCLGIGGDPVVDAAHIGALEAFEINPDTELVVMISEIGSDTEEHAAAWTTEHTVKPTVGYVAGSTAPEGKTMGRAGTIVSGSSGTTATRAEALEAVDVKVGRTPSQTAALTYQILRG